ncbi:50S ribosomal protein L31 [Striga asiatica]|uniref:50S ribosomal protein L31 n=1 Tax=Striga asiatica TaxID=4170 RepID=A0A5A7P5B5_STRAF|nr:50S ribosomal protein L31 [Striga asiatica]
MFRALSARRNRHGYESLHDDAMSAALVPKLSRAKSTPAKILMSCSKKLKSVTARDKTHSQKEKEKVKKTSKIHPFFSLFETGRKKKATAKPEFSRYLEYVREGGTYLDS